MISGQHLSGVYAVIQATWGRHQMETFSALLALCAGNSPVSGEFPAQRPVTRSFDVSFDLRLDRRLSKQSWGWWFETLSRSLWRHRNVGLCSCLHALVSMALRIRRLYKANFSVPLFSHFLEWTKYCLHYHVRIQLICGETWLVWSWFMI